MDSNRFDAIARSLARPRSRRDLAPILGGSVLSGAGILGLIPQHAEADARKRCRKKIGAFLSRGDCRCAFKCPSTANFFCHGVESCQCGETTEGKGFCADQILANSNCLSSTECPPDTRCVYTTCTETTCTTPADCPPDYTCHRGLCIQGACSLPCPT